MKLIAYTDGSSKPNPGYTGFGVHGYFAREKEKQSVVKHPVQSNYYLTLEGYADQKPEINIEVVSVFEKSVMIDGDRQTNNRAELQAVAWVMKTFIDHDDLDHVKIFTDSTFVVKGVNDFIRVWRVKNWLKRDGQPPMHIDLWREIDLLLNQYCEKKIKVEVVWIKGHEEDPGNQAAHVLSVIASRASEYHYEEDGQLDTSQLAVLDFEGTMTDYRNSFKSDDILYQFKELVYSSNPDEEMTYCFVYNPPKEEMQAGKKTTETMFLINRGFFPQPIKDLIAFHRSLPRDHNRICCIKLQRFKDKTFKRLSELTNIVYLLKKDRMGSNHYCYVDSTQSVVHDKQHRYALTYQWYQKFEQLYHITAISHGNDLSLTPEMTAFETPGYIECQHHDITPVFLDDEGKLKLTNKYKKIAMDQLPSSLGQLIHPDKKFKVKVQNKLELYVGKDIPTFLAMKRMEPELKKVTMIVVYHLSENTASCVVQFHLENRTISVTNILDKFLLRIE